MDAGVETRKNAVAIAAAMEAGGLREHPKRLMHLLLVSIFCVHRRNQDPSETRRAARRIIRY
jgi:hypothetical protein